MKSLLVALIISLVISTISGYVFIPTLNKIKASQTILKYVKEHKEKNGTPTMGGLFFILPASIVFLIFGGYKSNSALVALSIGLSFMLVGFLDDYIKIRYKKNEGLKPYQKIFFQLAIAFIAGFYAYENGYTVFYLPFSVDKVELGTFAIFVVAFIFIAITNSVNLTDGLDGLAGQVGWVYLVFMSILTLVQYENLSVVYLDLEQYYYLNLLSFSLVGSIWAFLIFNVNKARVFMGDTGSLSLGGFIGAISIFSLNSFFIPVIGIMFVLSSISVIVQVCYYKKTKKRVFLMAPLHHHFQLKGYTETQIGYCYSLITAIFGIVSLIPYL